MRISKENRYECEGEGFQNLYTFLIYYENIRHEKVSNKVDFGSNRQV